jgi:hypothetical protein
MILGCVAAAGCPGWPGGRLVPTVPADGKESIRAQSLSPGGAANPFEQTAEGLHVESVLLERPVGDPVLDRELWAGTRPVLPPEAEAILAENGLRVAVLSGELPPSLRQLIESESNTVNPHFLTFGSRREAVIPTAGPNKTCEYEVLNSLSGERRTVKLSQSRSGVLVRPTLSARGPQRTGERFKLRCEPRIQHGERQDWIRPSDEGTQFVLHGEVPQECYPELGFEVTLGRGDYLVIGWPASADRTLGSALFAVEADGRPRQRALLIRAGGRGERPGKPGGAHGQPIAAVASRR